MTRASTTTTTAPAPGSETEQVRAHHRSVKRLGGWTTARRFDVRAARGSVVLDLLLPRIEPGEIEIELDIDHSTVKLLVPDGANIDDDDLRRVGRGRVKDWTGTGAPGGRQIKLVGEIRDAEVRVQWPSCHCSCPATTATRCGKPTTRAGLSTSPDSRTLSRRKTSRRSTHRRREDEKDALTGDKAKRKGANDEQHRRITVRSERGLE